MKMSSKITVALILLFVSHSVMAQPANSSILAYNMSVTSWYAYGSSSSWSIGDSKTKGYLLFDVSYDPNTGYISDVNDVAQFSYGKSGSSKWYSSSSPSFDDIIRMPDSSTGTVSWALVQSDTNDEGGTLAILTGNVVNSKIGNPDPNEIATQFNGNQLYYSPGTTNMMEMNVWSLKLNRGWTKMYNQQSMNMTEAKSHVRTQLQSKGYQGTD